ncbi:30S ribosomal protein S16 [Streptomonospora litoralis]|uniref:Small ribosomal subunit protein bS16 n=1 Tax=Streptomonospora litoralis TaxID=2498135 RepID=A0A4P6Q4Z6_9ACTN|nr:30S ribosomal protein S16 [Streptomonospora litoralis]QBI55673.1 30S ribosomal protein S16 [Streptomonospora litoralis]
MAVKIKLKRMGKIRTPQYRIVVADARTKRDGQSIEEIGTYHPKEEPSFIKLDSERAQHWLSVGAQPTVPVKNLLKLTGDWQRFKGLPEPAPLKVAEPRDKEAEEAAFQNVLKELVLPDNESTAKGGGKSRKSSGSEKKAEKTENTGEDTTTEPEGEA